ncbi:MAG: WXG100 family type VII secretion target [Clostridium sp.]|nr:WXG100 family type VII secretion target [Clostridium sp.]
MAGQIRVNTDQVAQIATSIENLNNELRESLLSGQNTIKDLGNTWDGEAATATIGAFDEFASKYFQNYYDIIDNYVKFLRTNVDKGYFEVETVNTNLADAFK